MTKRTVARGSEPGAAEVRYRPMYARALGLRHLHPGGMLCFAYLEGSVALSLLLALAELVSWWVVLILPVSVALMVKVNDWVAGAVARAAARTPERERERVRREVSAFMPVVGRAAVVTQPRNATAPSTDSTAPAGVGLRDSGVDRLTLETVTVPSSLADGGLPPTGLKGTAQGEVAPLTSRERVAPGEVAPLTGREGAAQDEGAPHIDLASKAGEAAQGEAASLTDRERVAHDEAAPHTGHAGRFGQAAYGQDPEHADRREMAGRYAAAARHLDAAWRQHAYAMAHHTEHANHASQRERQSASRRYQ